MRLGVDDQPQDLTVTPAEIRAEVIGTLAKLTHDPRGFVKWAFPWGVPGTSLEREPGPEDWQATQQEDIGERLRAEPFTPILDATGSGHGIGKSTEVAWLILWGLMTRENTRGVVTANTDTQLRTKTWAELSKWYELLLPPLKDMFKLEATSIHSADKGAERTWRIDMVPWSERNTEAFAGLHNAGGRIIIIFDEASAISDAIWEVTEGATTDADTEILWLAYGNCTRNNGRFREAIEGRFRHVWRSRRIDSRKVKRTNKVLIEGWRLSYGDDSDFFRVRVKGEFPRAGSMQFIASDLVKAARLREPLFIASDPLIFGVDVARFGDDASVLAIRRGRDARSFPWKKMRGWDTMQVASYVAEQALIYRPDAIFVDVTGVGAGVADRLRQILGAIGIMVVDVNFGGKGGEVLLTSGDSIRVASAAAAMAARVRDWLPYGSIPDDDQLETDLTAREYGYDSDMQIQLEKKDDMKKRCGASPDDGDALYLTFAHPVQPRPVYSDPRRPAAGYDIHADLNQ